MRKAIGILIALAVCGLALPAFATYGVDEIPAVELLNNPTGDNLMFEGADPTRGIAEGFSGLQGFEVANGWTTFTRNDPGTGIPGDVNENGYIKFFKDLGDWDGITRDSTTPNNHITYPENYYAQGPPSNASQAIAVGRYGRYLPTTDGAAGFYRQVTGVTPGKIYMYHGYTDFPSGSLATGYRILFGINTTGGVDPGNLDQIYYPNDRPGVPAENVGGAKWGFPGYAFDWESGDSAYPNQYGGFHSVFAAWPAESSTISLWHGIRIHNWGGLNVGNLDTPLSTTPVWDGDHYEVDSMALHEFGFTDPSDQTAPPTIPVNASYNGDFEASTNVIVRDAMGGPAHSRWEPDGTVSWWPDWHLPKGWVPIGGAIGHALFYGVNDGSAVPGQGSKMLTLFLRRGVGFFGVMQQVKVQLDPADPNPADYKLNFSANAKLFTKNSASKAGALIGYDPQGGTDPTSPDVVWAETTLDTGAWASLSLPEANPTHDGQIITLFLMDRNVGIVNGVGLRGIPERVGMPFAPNGLGEYSVAYFDNVSFTVTNCPATPPAAFNVTFDSPSQSESHRIEFHLSTPPSDDACLLKQEFMIGTTPGGSEVQGLTPLPMVQDPEVYDVNLPAGNIYVTVRRTARGAGNLYTDAVSPAHLIDIVPNTYSWSQAEHVSSNLFSSDSPSIVCAADGVYLAYRDADGSSGLGDGAPPWWSVPKWAGIYSKIAFRKRVGSSWTEPKYIAENPNMSGEGQGAWDPYLVTAPDGTVHCLWQGGGTYYFDELWQRVTTDGGNNWSEDYFGLGDAGVNWFNKAVIDKNGNMVVACNIVTPMDPADPNAPGDGRNYQPSIMTFNGTNWVPESIGVAAVSTQRGAPTPTIAVDDSGRVYAVWEHKSADGWHLRFDRRDAPGAWSAGSEVVDVAAMGALPQSMSGNGDYAIAVEPDGSKIHVVFVANHTIGTNLKTPGVFYVNSTDGGATWSTPLYLTNGAWPLVRLDNHRLHIIAFAMDPTNQFVWQPRHMFIDSTGKPSATVDIGTNGYTSQPFWFDGTGSGSPRCQRTDYSWGYMTFSHLAPGSFDVDASGGLHFAWSSNTNKSARDYFWVDYFNTKGDVPAASNSIGAIKSWAQDGTIWSGGVPNKPVQLNNYIVTAEGSIDMANWKVPYVYIQEDDRSAGIRVLARQNIDTSNALADADPSDDIHVGDTVNILAVGDISADYNSAVAVDLTNNPIDWCLYGEPQIGRVSGTYGIKAVTMVKVVPGTKTVPPPLFMSGKTVGGVPGSMIPQVENFTGTPTIGLYGSVFGRATSWGFTSMGSYWFYLDDGSGVEGQYVSPADPGAAPDGRARGIKVYTSWLFPNFGDYYVVRGALSTERTLIMDPDGMSGTGDEVYGQIRVIRPAVDDTSNPLAFSSLWQVMP